MSLRASDCGWQPSGPANDAPREGSLAVKIAINQAPYDGPWGGGNRFVVALADAASSASHAVVHDLKARDIDVILMVDPRERSPNVRFGAGAILRYLALKNPNAIVVHRINECDERKNEAFINAKLVRANYAADVTVFVGEWLSRLPVWRKALHTPWFTVRNGADTRIFHRSGFTPWTGEGPLKLVTHHWGFHPMKGFDVYAEIDRLLGDPQWRRRLAFTYVGQLPPGFSFANSRYVAPLNGAELGAELRSHHAYLTASINEPGGNHQNEGALSGLPLLYRNSGCMPEYCEGFGIAFSGLDDFVPALEQLRTDYPSLVRRMPSFPLTAERMTREWLALLSALVDDRETLVRGRRLMRDPWAAFVTQIPL